MVISTNFSTKFHIIFKEFSSNFEKFPNKERLKLLISLNAWSSLFLDLYLYFSIVFYYIYVYSEITTNRFEFLSDHLVFRFIRY